MKTNLTIKGTHCNACKMLIEDVCKDHKEVLSCTVDFTTGKTEIEHNEALDLETLKKEIENLGDYKIEKEESGAHVCPECGFRYAEKEWAEKCEVWCKQHHSCNLEITEHALR